MPSNGISERDLRLLKEKFKDGAPLEAALKRLENREPLAYILGEWYFYDERYILNSDCLIPRPDTEILVEKIIKLLPQNGRLLDLCTGSGCVAISVLAHRPDCTATAVDISKRALEAAKENAVINGVADRIKFICEDIAAFTPCEKYNVISANPPYIAAGVIPTLEKELSFEPRRALDGGEDGLDFYRIINSRYFDHLEQYGCLALEIGYDQADAAKTLFGGHRCTVYKDYGGNDRVAVIPL